MKKIIATVSFSFLLVSALNAQTVEFPWMAIPSGAASLSMAGTGTLSDSNLAWSSNDSPASAVLSEREFAAEGAYSLIRPSGTSRIGAGAVGKLGDRFSLGGTFSCLIGNKYDVYNSAGMRTGTFSPNMLGMSLGMGAKLSGSLSLGASLQYAREVSAEDAKHNALAVSVMLAFRHEGFLASAGVHSLGSSLGSSGGVKAFPSSAKFTAGYDKVICTGQLEISACADADYYYNNSVSVGAGASVGYREIVYLRGGYRYSSSAAPLPSFAGVGLGFELKGIALNFAYLISNDRIGNSLQIGAGYSF